MTETFPRDELFGLTQQLRRPAISVLTNSAKGKGRGSGYGFVRLLATGSGLPAELETHFVIAARLGYINEATLEEVVERIEEVG